MWQKQLKQIKKTLPVEQKNKPNSLAEKLVPEEPKDISFSEYCSSLKIEPIKQDTLINKTSNHSKVTYHSTSISSTEYDSFEFMNIDDAPKEFFRFGQRLLPKQLRSEKTQINRSIDVHNMTRAHAISLIGSLIENADAGITIKIVHGVGINSEYNQPVLMGTIRKFLMQSPRVLGFSYADNTNGGNGVTLVKLTTK